VIYFAIRLLSRMFIIRTIKKHYSQQQPSNENKKPEGTVTIQNQQSTSSATPRNNDNYVDYEEIK